MELVLKNGMCIAIEPMITLGDRQLVMERDGWTGIEHAIEMCCSF
jgi:methionine aminopeptidase